MLVPPYRRRRARLVETLRNKGITDEKVLEAISRVPRHEFVEDAMKLRAYEDEALPIGLDQTISQPFTVAYQTSLLEVKPGDKILEVGTGSGYQAAVLCELGARVFSIERHKPLLDRTKVLLNRLGYDVRTLLGDGTLGWPVVAPFNGIVVTAGGTSVPEDLLDQLRPGGRLIIPVGTADKQTMWRITRTESGDFKRESLHDFRFVPLISDD